MNVGALGLKKLIFIILVYLPDQYMNDLTAKQHIHKGHMVLLLINIPAH